jgi:hypothetical protein
VKRHIVEIVFAERCPSVRHALERVREALAPVRDTVDLELRVTRVDWVERGVPAVLVDGALVCGAGLDPIRAALERARELLVSA